MKTLEKFSEFVSDITASNSRLYKIEVLTKYSNDEDIKYYLNYIFNPYITTGISTKKLQYTNRAEINEFDSVKSILNYVAENNTGTLDTIAKVNAVIDTLSDDRAELFRKIVSKNLKLGIEVGTINKVIPNLIPEFKVMLANKYFDNPKFVEGKAFTLTTKIDGGRIIAIKQNGVAKFYTRQGQEYLGLIDLQQEMEKWLPDNICLDGEITLLNSNGLDSKTQYKQTMMITRKDGEKHGVKMLVFDCMSANDFINQSNSESYILRRHRLDEIFNVAPLIYFSKLPILYSGTDTSEIAKWLKYNIDHKEEGVMININSAPYIFNRTSELLKVKQMADLDLEIIGFEEGSNKYSGTLGAILVNYKGYTVKVGSGFSEDLRDTIWNNQDEYIGRTATIQYFEETQNQNGGISLRFPVFIDVRYDK